MNKQSAQEELLAYQGPVDSVAALLALPGFFEAVRQLSRGMMARIIHFGRLRSCGQPRGFLRLL
jgi:hypothetical protein